MTNLSQRSIDWLKLALDLDWREGDPFPVLPDGVHLGCPEEIYFLQNALGSSDLADLWLFEEGWWWKSRNNPWWAPSSSKAKMFGSAAHTMLLEGIGAFEARWAVEPDPRHFPDLLVSVDDLVAALLEVQAPGASGKMKKKDLVDLAKVYLPGRHVWDAIKDRFERQSRGRDVVTAQERWELQVMLDAALADPDMRAVVTADGGVALAEVSVFWTLSDGIRLRFRFDSLLPAINADLKTLDNFRDQDLSDAVGKAIGNYALDVQAAQSFEARRQVYACVDGGQVFGGTEAQRAWLARFPKEAPLYLPADPALGLAERPGWAWLWMFYQKADSAGRAPIIFPVWMDFGGQEHLDGWRKVLTALAFYRQKVATVGLATPWTKVAPIHHMRPTATRRVEIPHWVARPLQVDGEEEGLKWRT